MFLVEVTDCGISCKDIRKEIHNNEILIKKIIVFPFSNYIKKPKSC